MAAARSRAPALEHVPSERMTKELCVEAAQSPACDLRLLPRELQGSPEVCLAATRCESRVLRRYRASADACPVPVLALYDMRNFGFNVVLSPEDSATLLGWELLRRTSRVFRDLRLDIFMHETHRAVMSMFVSAGH